MGKGLPPAQVSICRPESSYTAKSKSQIVEGLSAAGPGPMFPRVIVTGTISPTAYSALGALKESSSCPDRPVGDLTVAT